MTINKDFLDEDENGGLGGQTGEIHFRYKDVMSVGPRDDMLSPQQISHFENIHQDVHKGLVDKQRETRKERAAAKVGQKHYSANTNQYGLNAGGANNQFKQHWMSQLAKNSGKDTQVSNIPTENQANTNDKLKEELQNRLENRLRHQNTPKFHPKPQMR